MRPVHSAGTQSGHWTNVVGGVAIHLLILVVGVPILIHYTSSATFAFAASDTALPASTQMAVNVVHLLQQWGLPLLLVVLLADALVCWLSYRLGGRKGVIAWTVSAAVGFVVSAGLCVLPIASTARQLPATAGVSPAALKSLVNSPPELRKLATERLIEVALAAPDEAPWPWNELERRSLSPAEVDRIMTGLTAWLKREHPQGRSEPLHWVGSFLDRLQQRNLVGEDLAIPFVQALHGAVQCDPRLRLREGAATLELQGKLRNIWSDETLGLVLLNRVQAVTIDGQPVKWSRAFEPFWNQDNFRGSVEASALAPGKHTVRVEVLSALLPAADARGLSPSALPADWPPTKKQWTRDAEMELTIYPRDAEIVSLVQDPALDPQKADALSVKPINIYSSGAGAKAVVVINVNQQLPVPISFDVALQVAGQTVRVGTVWSYRKADGMLMPGGHTIEIGIPVLAADVVEADVLLKPNPKPVETIAAVERIWGGEIVLTHVPLRRLDLGRVQAVRPPQPNVAGARISTEGAVPFESPSGQAGPRGSIRLTWMMLAAGVVVVVTLAVALGLVLLVRKSKSGPGKVIGIGCAVLLVGGVFVLLLAVGGLVWFRVQREESVRRAVHAEQANLEAIKAQVLQAAEAREVSSSNLIFGPVIERVLSSRLEETTNWFLDLESGNTLMPPSELAESLVRQQLESMPGTRAAQFADWVKRTGADLAVYGPEAFETLGGTWVRTHGATYQDWDDLEVLTPAQALSAIRAEEKQPTWFGRPELSGIGSKSILSRSFSVNYFFRTREGTLGVLQVLGRDETSGGLRLRYKLAQPPPATVVHQRMEDLPASAQKEAVALFNDIEDFGHEFNAAFKARNLTAAQTGVRRLRRLLTDFNAVVQGTDCQFPPELTRAIDTLQQTLETGDWTKIERDAAHNEQYAREFKRIGNEMAALAQQLGYPAAASSRPATAEIVIAAGGAMTVAGEPCSAAELTNRLAALARETRSVLIRADPSVPMKQIAAMMAACNTAGIDQVNGTMVEAVARTRPAPVGSNGFREYGVNKTFAELARIGPPETPEQVQAAAAISLMEGDPATVMQRYLLDVPVFPKGMVTLTQTEKGKSDVRESIVLRTVLYHDDLALVVFRQGGELFSVVHGRRGGRWMVFAGADLPPATSEQEAVAHFKARAASIHEAYQALPAQPPTYAEEVQSLRARNVGGQLDALLSAISRIATNSGGSIRFGNPVMVGPTRHTPATPPHQSGTPPGSFATKGFPSAVAADLNARVLAADKISSFMERDEVLAAIAADAARAGEAGITRTAVSKMTSFMSRDEAITRSARLLVKAGKRAEALELAGLATSFMTRDDLIKELAK